MIFIMTTSHWLRAHSFKTPDTACDIVIVGGGYAGLSTAFWLSEFRPDLKIVIVERSFCGAGASGRNAGFLTIGSAAFYKTLAEKWGQDKALQIHQFATESIELVHQEILKLSPEIKYERSASLTLIQNEEMILKWKKAGFSGETFHFKWLNQDELPGRLQKNFYGGYEIGPEYKINPYQLLTSMKKLLEARKVQFLEYSSAYQVVDDGIQTELNRVRAKKVILALNGYFPEFSSHFKDFISSRRAQMLSVELEEDIDCSHLYYDPSERVYWRKAQEKILLIGGKRLLDEKGEVGTFEKISPAIQEGLESYLREQLGLKYKVIHRWSGTMGFTDHELPYLDSLTAPVETYMLGGFSGHGMGLGFRSGKELAHVILEGKESFFNQFKKAEITL